MRLWILVADQDCARLFAQSIKHGALIEVQSFSNFGAVAHNRELKRDRPSRVPESVSTVLHASQPYTLSKDKVSEGFARQISEVLERGRVGHQYDQLVLIAPPKFLGILHSALNKYVQERITAQVAHDLTTATVDEIQSYLPETLSFLSTV